MKTFIYFLSILLLIFLLQGNMKGQNNVGIGTNSPIYKLHVVNVSTSAGFESNSNDATLIVKQNDASGDLWKGFGANGGDFEIVIKQNGVMNFYNGPHVRTISLNPSDTGNSGHGGISIYNNVGLKTLDLIGSNTIASDGGGKILIFNSNGDTTICLDGDLNDDGRIYTNELQINGGSDIAELFHVRHESEIIPGMLVSIDQEHPGDLIITSQSYERNSVGVISGAGGIESGLIMSQKGSKASGETQVAIAGRVFCLADASFGQINPGDLLTSSPCPGYAMKVNKYKKARGAIIGKALSTLEDGKGLVLVILIYQ